MFTFTRFDNWNSIKNNIDYYYYGDHILFHYSLYPLMHQRNFNACAKWILSNYIHQIIISSYINHRFLYKLTQKSLLTKNSRYNLVLIERFFQDFIQNNLRPLCSILSRKVQPYQLNLHDFNFKEYSVSCCWTGCKLNKVIIIIGDYSYSQLIQANFLSNKMHYISVVIN